MIQRTIKRKDHACFQTSLSFSFRTSNCAAAIIGEHIVSAYCDAKLCHCSVATWLEVKRRHICRHCFSGTKSQSSLSRCLNARRCQQPGNVSGPSHSTKTGGREVEPRTNMGVYIDTAEAAGTVYSSVFSRARASSMRWAHCGKAFFMSLLAVLLLVCYP